MSRVWSLLKVVAFVSSTLSRNTSVHAWYKQAGPPREFGGPRAKPKTGAPFVYIRLADAHPPWGGICSPQKIELLDRCSKVCSGAFGGFLLCVCFSSCARIQFISKRRESPVVGPPQMALVVGARGELPALQAGSLVWSPFSHKSIVDCVVLPSCDLLLPFMVNPIVCEHGNCSKLELVDLGLNWCLHIGRSHWTLHAWLKKHVT